MIEIDGSQGEGGGQILRTAIALATALRKEVRIVNIRAGRPEPGLKAQHLTGAKAAAEICDGNLKGAEVGSRQVTYEPGIPRGGQFTLDVGTAGSTTLVLQTLMPALAYATGRVELHLTGGTDVKWSPPADYLRLVTLPLLKNVGFQGELELLRRGHYPRGGGEIRFDGLPIDRFQPLRARDPGDPSETAGVSHATGLPQHVAGRQAEYASRAIVAGGLPTPRIAIDLKTRYPSDRQGSGITVYTRTRSGAVLGADSLGERGKAAELVGSEAGELLVDEARSRACLDRHMGDMIVPYLALAEGVSEVSVSQITQHTLTNVKVAEQMTGVKFQVQGKLGQSGLLRVRGAGIQRHR